MQKGNEHFGFGIMGRGQAVLTDSATNTHYGASDPRADGSAEPEYPKLPWVIILK